MKLAIAARLAALILAFTNCTVTHAQDEAARAYPNKPVRLVLGYTAGGGTDIVARTVGAKLGESLGQPFVVENRAGAQSIIAAQYVAKAPPDGYTLLIGPSGPMTVNPATYAKLPYSPSRDFVPISMIGTSPVFLVVSSALPVRSVKELIQYAKTKPDAVSYGASSAVFQLATELFSQKTGTKFLYVPYKSAAEILPAVISGQVTIAVLDQPAVAGVLKGGKIRALAVLGPQRAPGWPDVPSIVEAGHPEIDVRIFQGLFAPAGTPPAIVKKIQEALAQVVRSPELSATFSTLGIVPSGNTSAEFGRIVEADIAKWSAVAKAGNVKAE